MSHAYRQPTVDGDGARHIRCYPGLPGPRHTAGGRVRWRCSRRTRPSSPATTSVTVSGAPCSRASTRAWRSSSSCPDSCSSRPYLARAAAAAAPTRSRALLPQPRAAHPAGVRRHGGHRTGRWSPGRTRCRWATGCATLTLVDVYFEPRLPQGLTQMWSLAVEVSFYVVLPLLMLIGPARGLRVRARLLLVLGDGRGQRRVAAWGLAGRGRRVGRAAMSWLPGYLGWFAVGIALALAHVHAERSPDAPWVRRIRMLGSCRERAGRWRGPAAARRHAPGRPRPAVRRHPGAVGRSSTSTTPSSAGLIVLTGVFTVPGSRYLRVMSLPLLRHLGHISYSVFCIHLVVLHAVMTARRLRAVPGTRPDDLAPDRGRQPAGRRGPLPAGGATCMRLKALGLGAAVAPTSPAPPCRPPARSSAASPGCPPTLVAAPHGRRA